MSFECHITVALPNERSLADLEKLGSDNGWKTSVIHGDPVLGTGGRFYFTKHDTNFITLATRMTEMCDILNASGANPIRRKIEAIIIDEVSK